MSTLPTPSTDAEKHSRQLVSLIQQQVEAAGGWIDFARFMQLALYAPGLGYYSAGSQKFGMGGDFVTAPEISPLFAQTLSYQVAQILREDSLKGSGNILELGAGTGKLAVDLLLTLARLEVLPTQYYILEVSDHLRQVQLEYLQKKLPQDIFQRVAWLDALPSVFEGVVLGNEVLDAIPVHIVHATPTGLCERGVVVEGGSFAWQDRIIEQGEPLIEQNLFANVDKLNLPEGYITEFCPAASGLIASLANMLQHGAILMIDYGFAAYGVLPSTAQSWNAYVPLSTLCAYRSIA